MACSSLTARGSIPAGISSTPISKRSSTRRSGLAEIFTGFVLAAGRFLTGVIGPPPKLEGAKMSARRHLKFYLKVVRTPIPFLERLRSSCAHPSFRRHARGLLQIGGRGPARERSHALHERGT